MAVAPKSRGLDASTPSAHEIGGRHPGVRSRIAEDGSSESRMHGRAVAHTRREEVKLGNMSDTQVGN
jgi:hypothetical protein